MASYIESADMFGASMLLLQSAKIVRAHDGKKVTDTEKTAILKRVGELLACVNWDKPATVHCHVDRFETAEATSIRPLFFETIAGMREAFVKKGVDSRDELRLFFSDFYHILMQDDEIANIREPHTELTIELLSKLSDGILQELRYASSAGEDRLLVGRC